MFIKRRTAKKSDRGIYLQDKELNQTLFQPGKHFKYVIDPAHQKIVILSSDDTNDNTVSKRQLENQIKPVIDIRNKKALSAFAQCDYLQVEIFHDQIIIEGYQQEKESFISKVKNKITKLIPKKTPVVDITQLLNVKKRSTLVLSKQELSQAVGHFQQLSFEFIDNEEHSSSHKTLHILDHLNHLHVPLQVASLFSGAGCFDFGFIEEGFDIVFALEKEEGAVRTYRRNISNEIVQADITQFDKSRITQAPIMIAGTPCQGFSNSNRYTNFLDNPNNQLVKEYIEAIKSNPNAKVFVLENVPQILSAGNGRFKEEIYEVLNDFEITSGIVSSAEMGSPQLRDRAIFIGSKIGKIELPATIYKPSAFKTVRDAFEGLHDGIPNQCDISQPKDITIERMKHVPPGGNVMNIPESIRPKGQHSDMYKRLEWDKPAVTIVNPRKAVITHPEEHRIISIREGARLLGLPDHFIFQGGLSSMQQQIANAVPLQLARSVAKVIKHAIMKFNVHYRQIPVPI